MKRTGGTKGRCNHPLCGVSTHLKTIPKEVRQWIAQEEKIFIPQKSVACNNHTEVTAWQGANVFITSEQFQFTKEHIEDMFKLLTNHSIKKGASRESCSYA